MNEEPTELQAWSALDGDVQVRLRAEYQSELDAQPLTCSLEEKTARFANWLAARGVWFTHDDLKRPGKR